MKEILLTQGLAAIIDDEDFDKVSQYKWFAVKARNGFYAHTWTKPWKERKMLAMHHLINGKPTIGMIVDHKDRNGLNNQKNNLRFATIAENGSNRTPWGASKYLGVSKVKNRERWRSFIGVEGKNIYLGIYKTEIEAAKAYNEAALKHKGEFANLNSIR